MKNTTEQVDELLAAIKKFGDAREQIFRVDPQYFYNIPDTKEHHDFMQATINLIHTYFEVKENK